jgi:crossover junction endodeoxyribonuclease RuvC
MLVLGIDPGTATTGFGLVRETDEGNLEVVDYGVILTPAGLAPEQRLLMLYNRIMEILLLHRPDQAAVEKLFFQRNVTNAIAVGQARGVVMLGLAMHGLRVAEYTPMEVKQAISGYGGADKHQVQVMVQAVLHLDELPRPDDAADALAISLCHLQMYRMRELLNPPGDLQ